MTGVFETVSELILFGFMPLLVTVGTVWIIWFAFEKINPDEVTDIGSFLSFIIAVVPFVMIVCFGLAIMIYDEMMAASVGSRSLPLVPSSREIFAGAVIYIGVREAKLLSKDEARRIAVNIAKLPELMRH